MSRKAKLLGAGAEARPTKDNTLAFRACSETLVGPGSPLSVLFLSCPARVSRALGEGMFPSLCVQGRGASACPATAVWADRLPQVCAGPPGRRHSLLPLSFVEGSQERSSLFRKLG